MNALQNFQDKIDQAFKLESVIVHSESWSKGVGNLSGVIIKPGMYPVTDVCAWNPLNLHVTTLTPRMAHHLRAIGKADVYYANGTVERARQLVEA